MGETSAKLWQKGLEVAFVPPTLVHASEFSIETLTDAYNQTRVDYMVPMPLNADRLREYVSIYDIDMERSVVAMAGEQILGINMIGSATGALMGHPFRGAARQTQAGCWRGDDALSFRDVAPGGSPTDDLGSDQR